MKIVVVGGSGLVGAQVAAVLAAQGHHVGAGDSLHGVDVVVDATDPLDVEVAENSTRDLLAAEAAAGVRHHVALSVVAAERLADSDCFRARLVREKLVASAAIPYTIVRATQFFESAVDLADAAADGGTVRFAPVLVQPVASADVARALAAAAVGAPVDGTVEVAGPQQFRLDNFIREALSFRRDPRFVITDPHARFRGLVLGERTLLPGPDAIVGAIRLGMWPGRDGTTPVDPL
ncbi:NmrA family transcriptional regulator [Asanoa sp. NPDC050611]|uniref:SDR family oxidoreductase n=1 Tax=Asanoa sp. NPDC050611 TaxID=3157098 RepID=UPI0033DD2B2F